MRNLLSLFLTLLSLSAIAQTDFLATQNGAWNLGTTWGGSCASGCTAGSDYPGPNDNAYTEGFVVRIPTGNFSVNNLYVAYNVQNGIDKTLGTATLIVRGQLASYDPALFDLASPTTNIVNNSRTSWTIQFTGEGLGTTTDPVIMSWSSLAPLRAVTFNPPSSTTTLYTDAFSIANAGSLTVANGTLTLNSGHVIQYSGTSATITVNSGATLHVQGAINGDGTSSSRFNSVSIDGTLTTGSTGYINASNFTLGATGRINVGFYGTNQTEGWWYQSVRPDNTFLLDNASIVSYNANQNQNFYATTYGNLRLSGSGTITKTAVGTGSLNVTGNLSFGNAGVTMNSSLPVVFNGVNAQNISGGGTANFNGGLEINKSAETFTLLQNVSVQSGLTITQGTLDANTYTIALSGNLSNNGTVTFGSGSTLGTLEVNGPTSLTGAVPSFGNITVNAAGSFSNVGTINVSGSINNAGTFNLNGINFNGTSAQTISGTLNLSDITVSNAAGVANNGSIDVTGTVTLTGSGTFDADGSGSGILTLKSTGLTTTARIAALPNHSLFSGNVTVERFINAPEDWRYLAIPITDGNVGMWQDDFAVTGNFTNPSSGGNVVNSTSPSIFYYDPAIPQWVAVGSGGSTTSTSLSNTTGYSVWSYLSSNVSVDVTGQIAKGQRSVSVRSGDNLIPNPYPSAIDWDNVNLSGANLNTNTIYVRTGNGTYASYLQNANVGTGHPLGNGWGGEIAMGQSFWVLGAGNGTINFQEDDKTTNTYFVRESTPSNYMRIKLLKDGISDDVVIHFKEGATSGKDIQFDALKKTNDIDLNLSTYNGDTSLHYAINGIPLIQCDYTTGIKLGNTNPEGNYTLSFEDLASIKLGYNITLRDNFLNVEKEVTEAMTYPFTVTSDSKSGGAARFQIIFKSPDIDLQRDLQLSSELSCDNNMVKLSLSNSQPGVQYVFKLNDVALHDAVTGDGHDLVAWVSKSSLAHGLNRLFLAASTLDGCKAHLYNESLAVRFEPIYEIGSITASEVCGSGSAALTASGAPLDGSYRWYESAGAIEPIAGAAEAVFNTPTLIETKTYYVTAVNANGCESFVRVPVEAKVTNLPEPLITLESNLLVVNQKSGIQWFKDGQPISGATGSTLEVKESGVYSCTVTKGACSTVSEGREFVISSIENVGLPYRVFPNPVEDFLMIQGDFEAVNIYDNRGRTVTGDRIVSGEEAGSTRVDMRGLKKGFYLLNFTNGKTLYQLKVIKK